MKLTLIEFRLFTSRVAEFLDSESYRKVQNALVENPSMGDVIPGCGGLRKLRVANPSRQKGKRGGCRIIYLHIPDAARLDLLAIYGKEEREDLSEDQKRQLKILADDARREACTTWKTRRSKQP